MCSDANSITLRKYKLQTSLCRILQILNHAYTRHVTDFNDHDKYSQNTPMLTYVCL